jgi:hypothetical protein
MLLNGGSRYAVSNSILNKAGLNLNLGVPVIKLSMSVLLKMV